MTPVNPGALPTRGILCFILTYYRCVSAISGTTIGNIGVRASTEEENIHFGNGRCGCP